MRLSYGGKISVLGMKKVADGDYIEVAFLSRVI